MSTLHHSAPPWNWGLQRTSYWKITVKIRIHWVSSTLYCSLRGYIKIWKLGRRGHLNDFFEEIVLIEDLIYWSILLYSLVQNNRSAHVMCNTWVLQMMGSGSCWPWPAPPCSSWDQSLVCWWDDESLNCSYQCWSELSQQQQRDGNTSVVLCNCLKSPGPDTPEVEHWRW